MGILIGGAGMVLGFSALIFIHELGHYLLAKWNGVRVHVFSLGMGPYLFSFTRGETLYAISMVPLGGYVKMAGQDDMRADLPETVDPRDYRNKRAGQKAAILAAGAIFNLIFALALFTVCYYVGVRMEAPYVGKVDPKSPLAKAEEVLGDKSIPRPLKEGDRITRVNGVFVETWIDLQLEVASGGSDREIYLDYERDGQPQQNPVRVRTERDEAMGAATIGLVKYLVKAQFNVGFTAEAGHGVEKRSLVYVSQFSGKNTPAERAGLQLKDRIVAVGGRRITDQQGLIEVVRESAGKPLEVEVERAGTPHRVTVVPERSEKDQVYRMGIGLLELVPITKVDERSAAYAAGMREGCFIHDFEELRSGAEVSVTFSDSPFPGRAQQTIRLPVLPLTAGGVVYHTEKPCLKLRKEELLVEALAVAWQDTIRFSKTVFMVARGLITRDVGTEALSGPAGIANMMTRVAIEQDLMYYLWFLAFLSVNLGIFQFIPIPLLDGWHLLMVLVEKIKGSPVAPRVQETFQYVGLFIILSLLLVATKNDLFRFFS